MQLSIVHDISQAHGKAIHATIQAEAKQVDLLPKIQNHSKDLNKLWFGIQFAEYEWLITKFSILIYTKFGNYIA